MSESEGGSREMAGQKAKELLEVARIGFERIFGKPPLAAEMRAQSSAACRRSGAAVMRSVFEGSMIVLGDRPIMARDAL